MAKFALTSGEVPQTPFYYYDLSLLRSTIETLQREASRFGYHVHYAMKACIDPRVLEVISDAGLGADCVSGWEVERALESGFSADRVVFAGVGKSDREIRFALDKEIFCFNCESLEELQIINSLAEEQGKRARVALRINPNVEPLTHKYITTGNAQSKFGIAYTEVGEALTQLSSMANVEIVGIHFHIGSQVLGMDYFAQLAQRGAEICQWFENQGISLQVINVGGGLGIDYKNPDENPVSDFKGYFEAFAAHLPEDKQIHFELGRSIVGQCGELVTRVLVTKKSVVGSDYAIVDAGFTELIRPALYGAKHVIENLTAQGEEREMGVYYIGGPVCESTDIFARELPFPVSRRGDILTIRSVGAYGAVMGMNYNMRPTPESYYSEQ
ncbi:MAG: diaminopimelate decarboxylase [Rikenellaceae bacterium]